jgi:drug/metabolite transporter (DMT)-like permease
MHHPLTGEFSALLVAVFWTITALAFESAGKRVGSIAVHLIRLVMAMIFLAIYSWFSRGIPFPTDATTHQWIWLSLSGMVGFVLGDLFLFESYTIIGSRMAMLIMTLAPPMTAMAGWLWLDESLSPLSILGITITFSGILLATTGRNPAGKKLQFNMPLKGFLLAFGGACGQALGLVLSKLGMAGYDAFAATQIRIITGIAGFSLIVLMMGKFKSTVLALKNPQGMAGITVGSFFGPFLGVSLSLYAVKFTATGIAATIISTIPILIIAPAILIFKQKVTGKEILGAVISVIGVGLFFIK